MGVMAVLFGVGCVLTCVNDLVVLLLLCGIEITTVGVWLSGGVAVWWRCGGVAVWRCGGVVVWWCGGVVVWRYQKGSGVLSMVPTGPNGLT